jgi:hypothetical protein
VAIVAERRLDCGFGQKEERGYGSVRAGDHEFEVAYISVEKTTQYVQH